MTSEQAPAQNYHVSHHSVLGKLWAAGSQSGLTNFEYGIQQAEFLSIIASPESENHHFPVHTAKTNKLLKEALLQVLEYLEGKRRRFTLRIDWQQFTSFQAAVYQAVIAVPYGQTRTYTQIAAEVGRPKAVRAVGSANAANPLPIIIPCHRLVGKDGSLRGYGGIGGLQTKQWLLDHEKQHAKNIHP